MTLIESENKLIKDNYQHYTFITIYFYIEFWDESSFECDGHVCFREDLIDFVRPQIHIVQVNATLQNRHRKLVLVKSKQVLLEVLVELFKYFPFEHI